MDNRDGEAFDLDVLEFAKIRAQVGALCFTDEGRRKLDADPVLREPAPLERLREEVGWFLKEWENGWPLPALDCPPVAGILARCAPEGSVLDGIELKALGRYLSSAGSFKALLASREASALRLRALGLSDFADLAGRLGRLLDAEGQLVEEAVPSLRALKKDIGRCRAEIDAVSRSYLRDQERRDLWQTDTPTQKDGRTVLPLKAGFKGRIPSLVHESSASGATLYVEPLDLVEKNNRLVEAENAYRLEVLKILRELTALVRTHRDELSALVSSMAELDGLCARAHWGFRSGGAFPRIVRSTAGWRLVEARHPLLGERAVPISLGMEEGVRVLLISGPNTGGKTVGLKTAALLSVLHQFGLPIPAGADSELPVWDSVLADIGDGQSLDQALSTFSSHMKRVGAMLRRAGARSLILLDELGTGTDPLEGGALGMVFLERFSELGARVLVTTHHGALKNFAYTRPGMKNAAVEFDAKNGLPTYRILADIPGSSHALDIALAMGLPLDLVGKARSIVEGGEGDVARIIRSLKEKQLEVHLKERLLEEKERNFLEEKRKIDLLQLRLKQKENELRSYGVGELNRFLAESRRTFERIVQDVREGQLNPEKVREARAFFAQAEAKAGEQREEVERTEQELLPREPASQEIREGTEVSVEPQGQRGLVLRAQGKDRFLVAVGSIRITVDRKRLRPVAPKPMGPVKPEIFTSDVSSDNNPVFTLDVRGMRLDEALHALELQVDRALLKGLSEFSIIHGLGEGVLMKGVQEYLRGRREVKKFFFGHPEEGGFGKTIVHL